MPLRVHFPNPHRECRTHLERIIDHSIEMSFDSRAPRPCEVLIAGRPSREQVESNPELRSLIVPWAGIPRSTLELMRRFSHITVHNLHHNAQATAELAFGLFLAAAKRIVPLDRRLRRGDWSPRYDARSEEVMLLEGRTALILGAGAIGSRIARMCEAFGMRTTEITRSNSGFLHEHLPFSDAMFLCVPESAATRGMIGADEIGALPREAIVINVARGAVVDERALYESLRDGRIGAAGLDVWWSYPEDEGSRRNTPPSRFPFRGLDNVIMSPHRAGHCERTERWRAEAIAQLLDAAKKGELMPNRVDLRLGY